MESPTLTGRFTQPAPTSGTPFLSEALNASERQEAVHVWREWRAMVDDLRQENAALREQVALLTKHLHGEKSEV